MDFVKEEIEQLAASIDTKVENHLIRIEDVMTRKLNSVLEVNAMLMRENVQLRTEAKLPRNGPGVQEGPRSVDVQMGNTGNTGNTANEPSQSNVYMSPTEYGYRIWGKTFDVKDTIKTLGNVTFDGQMKSWKLQDCEMQMEEIRSKMSKVCNFEVLSQ